MVVPTGTSSPWSELTTTELEGDCVAYYRSGHKSESADLLAEALRADGIVRSLGVALPRAEEAELRTAYFGFVDEGDDPYECDESGVTDSGEAVDQVYPCIIAIVDLSE